jgi:site-specific recombinase XerD
MAPSAILLVITYIIISTYHKGARMGELMTIEQALYEADADKVEAITRLVTDTVESPHTKRAYARAIRDFLAWYRETGQVGLNKALVVHYAATLRAEGLGAASINQRLSAIRKLAQEAADNEVLGQSTANGIKNVRGVKQQGQRMGFWLARDQAQALLDAPDTATLKGLRDRAMLAVMLGCGLRRSEVAGLTFAHIQRRDGRWVVVDLVGKGNRTRSVVMPKWAKDAIDAWVEAAGLTEGLVFRAIKCGGRVQDAISTDGVAYVVKQYGRALGFENLAAHDLRRTYAKLARKGGADLEQIQINLGHASLTTTERYLGTALDLEAAPCDALGLS